MQFLVAFIHLGTCFLFTQGAIIYCVFSLKLVMQKLKGKRGIFRATHSAMAFSQCIDLPLESVLSEEFNLF